MVPRCSSPGNVHPSCWLEPVAAAKSFIKKRVQDPTRTSPPHASCQGLGAPKLAQVPFKNEIETHRLAQKSVSSIDILSCYSCFSDNLKTSQNCRPLAAALSAQVAGYRHRKTGPPLPRWGEASGGDAVTALGRGRAALPFSWMVAGSLMVTGY